MNKGREISPNERGENRLGEGDKRGGSREKISPSSTFSPHSLPLVPLLLSQPFPPSLPSPLPLPPFLCLSSSLHAIPLTPSLYLSLSSPLILPPLSPSIQGLSLLFPRPPLLIVSGGVADLICLLPITRQCCQVCREWRSSSSSSYGLYALLFLFLVVSLLSPVL